VASIGTMKTRTKWIIIAVWTLMLTTVLVEAAALEHFI
jgi:hypothetical protein